MSQSLIDNWWRKPDGTSYGRIGERGEGYCARCDNDGQVVYSVRPAPNTKVAGFEEMAPCPDCMRGYCLEFGIGRKKVLKGQREVIEEYVAVGPWGSQGFWRGRDPVEPVPERNNEPLPPEENAQRMKELGQKIGLIHKPMPESAIDELLKLP